MLHVFMQAPTPDLKVLSEPFTSTVHFLIIKNVILLGQMSPVSNKAINVILLSKAYFSRMRMVR